MNFNFNFNFPFAPETARLMHDEPDEPIEHPPIIIDSGSASIRFSSEEYEPVGGKDEFKSDRLFLHQIKIVNNNSGAQHVCYTLPAGIKCKVVVTCQRGANPADTKDFTIIGANLASGGAPTIGFDLGEFTSVASGDEKYQKYSNSAYTIKTLKVYKVVGNGNETLIHNVPVGGGTQATACPSVPENGNCVIMLVDKHLGP